MSDTAAFFLVIVLLLVAAALGEVARAVLVLSRDGLRIRDEVLHKIQHEIKEERESWQGGDGEGTPP